MGNSVKPTDTDIATTKSGMKIQYEAMFDANTRAKLEALGINRFMDHVALVMASQEAYIRFYANCLHPKSE
jgi:predicted SnoaL-like aldol condensation-catalyzing enzyme